LKDGTRIGTKNENSIQFGTVILKAICRQDDPSASDPKAFALLLVPCSWAEELQHVAEEVEAAIGAGIAGFSSH